MENYNKFFSNYQLTKKDLSSFVKDNELTQIKLFINSLKPGDILYDYEKILRQLCELPNRKVQKGDINLRKRECGIIQLGYTTGKCIKDRKNSYSWSRLCICCKVISAHYPDKYGNKNVYCKACAVKNNCYKIQQICILCKKKGASQKDEHGKSNMYCADCSKEQKTYQIQNLCKICNKISGAFSDEYGNLRVYCKDCAVKKNCYQKLQICILCKEKCASQKDEHGKSNMYCTSCSKQRGCYIKINPCINCNEFQASFPDENNNSNMYCSLCAKIKDCYKKPNLCKLCKVISAHYPDKNNKPKQLCSKCSKEVGTYKFKLQNPCRICKVIYAHYPDKNNKPRQLCSKCSKEVGAYKLQNPCRICKKINGTFPDKNGKPRQLCSKCSKEIGTYKLQNPCRICKKINGTFPDENGKKFQYCSECARLKGCYKLKNPCQKCQEITGHITCAHVTKNNNGTYTTTKLNLCVSCAIKLKLYDPKKNQHKSEKRFRKEMKMFVKEQEENEYINLDFENTMFTNCIDNEEICRNKFSLRLDGLLQYRGIYWLLENDEHQHSYEAHYPLSCELDRMMKAINLIRLQGITERVVFIRFNPDAYHHNGKKRKIGKDKRFQKLKELLRIYTPTQDFEIHYMYYDTIDDSLELQSKNEWVNTLNRFVRIHK